MPTKLLRRKRFWIGIALVPVAAYLVYAVIYVAFDLGCRPRQGSGIVPDRQLEAAIRYAIEKPEAALSPRDLESLTKLHASSEHRLSLGLRRMRVCGGIRDLTGLEHAVNLTTLYLGTNEIDDLAPLSALTNLTALDLHFNQIRDISALSSLRSLTWLDLSNNQVSDISPLSSLTRLTNLSLRWNKISDISPLTSLNTLTILYLDHNNIRDISLLRLLTNLQHLGIEHNAVDDISALADNGGLGDGDTINFAGNPVAVMPTSDDLENFIILEGRGVKVHR